ncbi:DUF2927 domain-containing protein [Oceanicella sp. SM1341]|uniref:DUF2927 domain-containing protein n=1 Tax=Oceanicella sp. SM1341 TaxID=1548889 RepID=UPI0013003423|nr:DUF2927 domain-containing protein [Oceanicella sp. SM1341]
MKSVVLAAACLLVLSGCERPLETQYRELGNLLSSTNRMRTDYDPTDAPVTRDMLVRDFETIALYYEHGTDDEGNDIGPVPTPLERWEQPVRVRLIFDHDAERPEIEETMRWTRDFTARLTRLSGVPITVTGSGPEGLEPGDMIVLFYHDESRAALADALRSSEDGSDNRVSIGIRDTPAEEICFFWPVADDETHELKNVLMIMKSETRDLMRLSCIHEELTQAMGLYNDDDDVRPSLFNDDEEFALLTRHDALLLRMLYDPALTPGMSAEEVRPLLPAVADRALAADAAAPYQP